MLDSRAATRVRWPMPFRLEPADASLFETAKFGFSLEHDYRAPPDVVHKSFLAFVGDPPWSPGFLGVDWWTPKGQLDGAVMDELYAFMSIGRSDVIEHTPGRRSLTYVERWSMPLARRMVQLIADRSAARGRHPAEVPNCLRSSGIFSRLVPPIQWAFKEWFEISLTDLHCWSTAIPGAVDLALDAARERLLFVQLAAWPNLAS